MSIYSATGNEIVDTVDSAGWRAIDAAEIARGRDDRRPRCKFTNVADMLAAAATAQPAPRRGFPLPGPERARTACNEASSVLPRSW